MKAKITIILKSLTLPGANFFTKKAALFVILTWSFVSITKAQNEHHEDSTVILNPGAFSVSILNTSDSIFQLQIINNQNDSITPFFVEFSINGFNLKHNGIIQQSVNNMLVESNIEKIFGPQFISLGLGEIPPFGNYKTLLCNNTQVTAGSSIQIRIFGTINGHNVYWSGNLNK